MTYTVYRLGNGWYDFKDIPQGYIKVHGNNCESDETALEYAHHLLKSYDAKVVIKDGLL